jgi:hypothetical protein
MKAKIYLSLLFFVLLVYGTYWWLHRQMSFDITQFTSIDNNLFYIGGFLSLFLFITDAFRYMTLIRSLNEKISFPHALEAGVINFFFAWTTPGAILAAPMTSYFLVRRKCSLEVSLLSSFGKSIIGLIYLLFFTLIIFYLSGIYNFFDKNIYLPIYIGLLNYFLLIVIIVLFAIFPWKRNLLPHKIIKIIEKLRPLFKNMLTSDLLKIALSQIIYFLFLIFFTGLLIRPFLVGVSPVYAFALASIFLSLIYLSPTPGGVGIGELVGIPILGKFMSVPQAVALTVLVRVFVVYVPIILGAIYLTFYFFKSWLNYKGFQQSGEEL